MYLYFFEQCIFKTDLNFSNCSNSLFFLIKHNMKN